MPEIVKAHAYGNDFLFTLAEGVGGEDLPALARGACNRHTGIGADGLIVYNPCPGGASMRLFNADGSVAEVSGNGVRCLGALLAEEGDAGSQHPGEVFRISTDAGVKTLTLIEAIGRRFTFRAAMGAPENIRQLDLLAGGERVKAVALTVGNPQCVVLGGPLTDRRLSDLGPAIERHPMFPQRTNVELATLEDAGRVRILIWERGVGPTQASGTGACAAVVAAAAFGGAPRELDVVSPGGTQHVEWRDDGLYLTGWATVVLRGWWLG